MQLGNPRPQKVTAISAVNQPLVDRYADLFYRWAVYMNDQKYEQANMIRTELHTTSKKLPINELIKLQNEL